MTRDFQQTPVRVVIVDDHRLFVDALALLLGHDERLQVIGTASDGPTAIELVVDGAAEVAVIDVRMPEVDGLETARRLRKRSPDTSVILVTGLDEPKLVDQAREAGAVALLKKGALHDQLKEAIIAAVSASLKGERSAPLRPGPDPAEPAPRVPGARAGRDQAAPRSVAKARARRCREDVLRRLAECDRGTRRSAPG